MNSEHLSAAPPHIKANAVTIGRYWKRIGATVNDEPLPPFILLAVAAAKVIRKIPAHETVVRVTLERAGIGGGGE